MKQKVIIMILFVLITVLTHTESFTLFDGNQLEGKPIFHKDSSGLSGDLIIGYTLSKTYAINTPAGNLKIKGDVYIDGTAVKINLAAPQLVMTPSGQLKLKDMIVFSDKSIAECHLSGQQEIKTALGILKTANRIDFYDNGELFNVFLSNEESIDTVIGKMNVTYINFYEKGIIHTIGSSSKTPIQIKTNAGTFTAIHGISFYRNGSIEAFSLDGTQTLEIKTGSIKITGTIDFYETGTVKSARLEGIQHISTAAGGINISQQIGFYENQSIAVCFLSGTQEINISAGKIKTSNEIYFHNNGSFKSIYLAESQNITTPSGKLKFGGNNDYKDNFIYFNESGSFISGYLTSNEIIITPVGKLKISQQISFYFSGKIKSVYMPDTVTLMSSLDNINIYKTLRFYENGAVKSCEFVSVTEIKFIFGKYKTGALSFYENGKIKTIVIGDDYIIGGFDYCQWSVIYFSEKEECLGLAKWDEQKEDYEPIGLKR